MAANPPVVQYANSADGFSVAFGISGTGIPLVFLPLTFSHVQLSWTEGTNLRAWLDGLSSRFRLIQYDGRGQGMSTRSLTSSHSAEAELRDLEAVIAHLDLESFVLLARGPLGHAAVRYAVANPQRVSALILFSLPASGSAWPTSFAQRLAGEDWDLFLKSFFAFDGRPTDSSSVVPHMRQTVTQEDWAMLIENWLASDVTPILGEVHVPTLVMHPREVLQPHLEESQKIAAGIPGARMTILSGAQQLGAPEEGLAAIDAFMAEAGVTLRPTSQNWSSADRPKKTVLTRREMDVLRLIVAGNSNQQIADELSISLNTAIHHVGNILNKTDSANRTEATSYAHRHGLV